MYERIDYANAAIKQSKKPKTSDSFSDAGGNPQSGHSGKAHDEDFLSNLKFPFEDQTEDKPDND